MKIIKVSLKNRNWPYSRQSPKNLGIWNDWQFVFDENLDNCDSWVVVGDLAKLTETTLCTSGRVLFMNDEPPTMRTYPQKFINQFSAILTCSGGDFFHENLIRNAPPLPWYFGIKQHKLHNVKLNSVVHTYDDLQKMNPPEKNKLLSIVFSDVNFTEGHVNRKRFVSRLKEHFGDKLDIYGKGHQYIEDKSFAILDYKFHLVIENSRFDDYWSEKLSDCYLGWAFPIYCGCTNIDKYFDSNSFEEIDINDIDGAITIIEDIISRTEWSDKVQFIQASRQLVLDTYNFFPNIIRILESMSELPVPKKIKINSISCVTGRARSFLRKTRAKLQFGFGVTKIFKFLQKI